MTLSSTGVDLPTGVTENLGYQNYDYIPNGEETYIVRPSNVTASVPTNNPYAVPSDVGTPIPTADTPMGTFETYYGTPWNSGDAAPIAGLKSLGLYIGGPFGGPTGNGTAGVWGNPDTKQAYYIDQSTSSLKPFPSDVSKWSWNGMTGYDALARQLGASDRRLGELRAQQLSNDTGIADYGLPIVLGAATLGMGGLGALGDLFTAAPDMGLATELGGGLQAGAAASAGDLAQLGVGLPTDLGAESLTSALTPTQAGMDAFSPSLPYAETPTSFPTSGNSVFNDNSALRDFIRSQGGTYDSMYPATPGTDLSNVAPGTATSPWDQLGLPRLPNGVSTVANAINQLTGTNSSGHPLGSSGSSLLSNAANVGSFLSLLYGILSKQNPQNAMASVVSNPNNIAAGKTLGFGAPSRQSNSRLLWRVPFSGTPMSFAQPVAGNPSPAALMARGGSLAAKKSQFFDRVQKNTVVPGEDGGQADTVPAMLSPGEYVMDAETVSHLGDGNNAAGARQLDQMRENIRAHKRKGALSSIPPKAKPAAQYLPKGA